MWQKWCAVIETHKRPHCFLTLSWLLTKSFCTFPAAALGSSCGCMASSARTDLFNVTLSWFWPGQRSSSHSCGEGSGAWSRVCAARFIILFHAHLHWEPWLWVEEKWTNMEPELCCSLFQGSKVLGELVGGRDGVSSGQCHASCVGRALHLRGFVHHCLSVPGRLMLLATVASG